MDFSLSGPQNGSSQSCTARNPKDYICGGSLNPCTDMTSAMVKDSKTSPEITTGNGNASKDLNSLEKPHKGALESRRGMEQHPVGTKGDQMKGERAFLTMRQAALHLNQKGDRKQLGKRIGRQSERGTMQQKKVRPSNPKGTDGSRSPARKILKKLVSSPPQRKQESLKDHKPGSLVKQESKPAAITALFKVQPKMRFQDITKEEAALEYRQCVSLLQKYGVLNSREFYLSQNLPRCALHPGSVGDMFQPKQCKICRAPEDVNSTIICDGCQEAFHFSCCIPRLNLKHFDKEDNWYCGFCKKQKRRAGGFNSCRFFESVRLDNSGKVRSAELGYTSKVRLGLAHQAQVPVWTGKVDDRITTADFGREKSFSQGFKSEEKTRISKEFELRVQTFKNQSANGIPENWLKCNNVRVQAIRGTEGHQRSEVICGKWRRAPLNIQQSDRWECFCVIEWDPLHADCAVPQELPTEDVLQRMRVNSDLQQSEVPKLEEG